MSLRIDLDDFPAAARAFEQSGPARVVLGGGCFWCTEAVFLQLDGVSAVVSGYAGGDAAHANYDSVCSGMTDHAEVIAVDYDSDRINLADILKVFFSVAHDPTHKDRQGNDRGRQYRSVVFFDNDALKTYVADYMAQLEAAHVYTDAIATTLEPLTTFYPAEDYHQDYYKKRDLTLPTATRHSLMCALLPCRRWRSCASTIRRK